MQPSRNIFQTNKKYFSACQKFKFWFALKNSETTYEIADAIIFFFIIYLI